MGTSSALACLRSILLVALYAVSAPTPAAHDDRLAGHGYICSASAIQDQKMKNGDQYGIEV